MLCFLEAFSINILKDNQDLNSPIRHTSNLLIISNFILLIVAIIIIVSVLLYIFIKKRKTQQIEETLNPETNGKTTQQIFNLEENIAKQKKAIEFLQTKNEELLKDNTIIQKSEEKYHSLVKYSPTGILFIDKNGFIIEVNQAMLDILGSTDENKTKSFNLIEYQPIIDSGMANNLKKCLENNEIISDECLYFSYWGKRIYLKYFFVPIKMENGVATHVLANIEDITSRKNVEIKMRESEQKLREVNLAKDKFFSIIAHDIKTPFNAILGFSELLKDDFDNFNNEEIRSFIKNINDAAEITYKLLENLLEWSRMQTGKMSITSENIDLSLVVNETISFLKPTAEKKFIQIHSEINYNTTAYADKNMITTVIRNLISNAIKFSFPNGLIKISAKTIDKFIEINVSDNGIGISPQDSSKIFKLDAYFKKEGTAKEQGTGLGLILCKEFVEKNGGWIWVESESGKGSSFKFTLPKE